MPSRDRTPLDLSRTIPTYRGPWAFVHHYAGLHNVVQDTDGRVLASHVPIDCGPLLAAGPTLLAALHRVARVAEPGSAARDIAIGAIEDHHERAGIALDLPVDVQAGRGLRIVGVAK